MSTYVEKVAEKLETPITEITKNVRHTVCDCCDKNVLGERPEGWITHTHSHAGWGNDSCESYKAVASCSLECFLKNLQSSENDIFNYFGAEVTIILRPAELDLFLRNVRLFKEKEPEVTE